MAHEKLIPGTSLMQDEAAIKAPVPTPPARPGNKFLFPRLIAWLVLAISLLASAGGWFIAWNHAELKARNRFDEEAGKISASLTERMQIYENVLHGALGLFAASSSVERAEWRAYLNSVSIERRLPGIDGVGYIAYVPRRELDHFLQTTVADSAPDFRLKEQGSGEVLMIIKYLEPETNHVSLLGRNIAEDPARRAAAQRACDSGKAALTERLKLLVEGRDPPAGFLMLLPVFRHGASLETVDDRRGALQGWVFARFVTEKLMRAVLGSDPQRELHLRIRDTDATDSTKVVFDQDPAMTQYRLRQSSWFSTIIPATFGGRTWNLNFSSTPFFEAANRRGSSLWVGAAGGAFSLLLFGIAWSLSHTRERALLIASDMTSTLRETNDRLQAEIRERRRSEQALGHSEALYHSLVESLPLSIVRKDVQGRFTFANQRFCAEVGKSLQELVGKKNADLFPPKLAAQAEAADRKVIESGSSLETVEELPIVGEKSVRYFRATRTPLYDGGNTVIGLLEIFRDITDKHRAEAELEHERFLLRTLMENVPERIYFKDLQSRFIRNNRAHLRTFALSRPEEAIGKTDFDFFSAEHARQAYEDEQRLIATGEPITKEEKETWLDGSVSWVLSTKMPLRDEAGNIVGTFGISRDITDQKRAEEAMRTARDAAEDANQTKSRFLANMSHELRTPLNSVIGFANILLKNKAGSLTSSELNFLERILSNGKHLLTLINEILDLSKIEARKMELQVSPVMLDMLIKETISQQESIVRDKPIRLLADLPAKVAPMITDADKLRQVIINLMGNAVKFTEQGTVTVRLLTDPADDRPLRIDVIDTGIGIPQDKLALIFEAFQQAEAGTARKYGGTGLGLTISQALCRLMGYHIEVASEIGRGSIFSVHLAPQTASPLVQVPQSQPGPNLPPPGRHRGKMVLVIDDELDSRTLLTHAVEELGFQALAANSGEQGLRMAREFQPDVITVDLMMPELNGWQVIQALKADPVLSNIPVVVVSIVAGENRGRILGAVEVLQKPVNRAELLAVLQRCVPASHPRVLIVDDESDSRELMRSHLQGAACELQTATNGREAMDLIQTFQPDLVLLDLIMPVMDGISFLNRLRSTPRFRFLPVIIVTAKDLTTLESRQLKLTAQAVVQKGNNLAVDLERVLHKFLGADPQPLTTTS